MMGVVPLQAIPCHTFKDNNISKLQVLIRPCSVESVCIRINFQNLHTQNIELSVDTKLKVGLPSSSASWQNFGQQKAPRSSQASRWRQRTSSHTDGVLQPKHMWMPKITRAIQSPMSRTLPEFLASSPIELRLSEPCWRSLWDHHERTFDRGSF